VTDRTHLAPTSRPAQLKPLAHAADMVEGRRRPTIRAPLRIHGQIEASLFTQGTKPRMRHTRRLLLLLLLPVVGFPMLLVMPVAERLQTPGELQRNQQLFVALDALGDTLHALQGERLTVTEYLGGPKSIDDARLHARFADTDIAMSALTTALAQRGDPGFDTFAVPATERVDQLAESLRSLRAHLDSDRADPMTVVESYARISRQLLSEANELSLGARVPIAARGLAANATFLTIKELYTLGAAQALLDSALQTSGPSASYGGYAQLLGELRIHDLRLQRLLAPESLALYQALQDTPAVRSLELQLNRLAQGAAPAAVELNSTALLERLRDLELTRLNERRAATLALLREQQRSAIWFTGWAALLSIANLICLVLGYLLIRRWTERLQVDRDQAARLGWIAQHTHKMAMIADRNGCIEWVNDGFEQMTGYSFAEVHGRDPTDLLLGTSQDRSAIDAISTAVARHRDIEIELVMHTKDQRPYWVRLEIRAREDESGEVNGFIALGTDITWQKDYEAALQHANERFEQIASQSREIIWETDIHGHLTYLNAAATELLGYAPDALLGQPLASLLAADSDAGTGAEQLEQLLQLTPGSLLEVAVRASDGLVHYCIATAGPIMDGSGTAIGWRGAFNDVSDRKLAERRLRESESRLMRAMSGSADGYWDLDLTSGQLYVSPRFNELLGLAAEEAHTRLQIGINELGIAVHPDDLEQVNAVHRAHLDHGAAYDVTIRLLCRNGEYRWFRVRAATVRDDAGNARQLSGVMTDVTELKEAQGELEWRALHDPLTGLANRQSFLGRLKAIQTGSRRSDSGLCAILSMDFDRFKLINDVHGHHVGDELLCSIARRLRGLLRERDVIARFGGDEFIILLVDATTVSTVQQITSRISARLAEPHALPSGIELTCTASIGVIVLDPTDARPADLILREADAAMYQAKTEAKGSFRFFDRVLRQQMNRKALLEADLRKAVPDAHFKVLYQPIVDLRTGEIAGFEALLRWWCNGQDSVSPAEFIPLAEDTGLIVDIGQWVFDRACRDLGAWRAATPLASGLRLSVNVSRRELIEPDFTQRLLEAVHRHGLAPSDIALELTETALVDERFDLKPLARELRDVGFRLAMDDFGTGQSSLNSLIDLPIQTLKIDKQFIRNMGTGHASIAVVHAVVTLAAHLDLEVVAEGIENAVETGTLQAMDCRYGQGFHFSHPVPAVGALALITDGLRRAGAAEADPRPNATRLEQRTG